MLADSSAWIWSRRKAYPELRVWFDEQLEADAIVSCDLVRLELLYGTRNGDAHDQRKRDLGALDTCPITPVEWRRAIDVQGKLAHLGPDRHKQVKIAGLLVAAAAESAGVEVLHYDSDFEVIAEVTGQPICWLAPRGSLR